MYDAIDVDVAAIIVIDYDDNDDDDDDIGVDTHSKIAQSILLDFHFF